jgi:hypothetical protein
MGNSHHKKEDGFSEAKSSSFHQGVSLSTLDSHVINRSSHNISKLLRKIDNSSSRFLEWIQQKEEEAKRLQLPAREDPILMQLTQRPGPPLLKRKS